MTFPLFQSSPGDWNCPIPGSRCGHVRGKGVLPAGVLPGAATGMEEEEEKKTRPTVWLQVVFQERRE